MGRSLLVVFVSLMLLAIMPKIQATGQTIPPSLVHLPIVRLDLPQSTALPTPPAAPVSRGDIDPPHLVAWSYSPAAVDTFASDQVITFTAHITDDLSGVSDGQFGDVYGSPSQARFRSPSGRQERDILFSANSDLIAGDTHDGIYQSTLTLPRFSETGRWEVEHVNLVDEVGNRVYLSRAELAARGLPTSFLVGQ